MRSLLGDIEDTWGTEEDLQITKPGASGIPTMADVAKLAGVSTATVSRVLHDNKKVKDDSREKVQRAIETLGYAPHLGAQELASGRTHVIGVVVNTIGNPVSAAIIQGVEERFHEHGYRLLLSNSYYQADVEEKLIRTYLSVSTTGIIAVGGWCTEEFYGALPRNDVPIVLINPEGVRSRSSRLPTIAVDGVLGGKLAGEHLIELGHRRIAYIGRKPVGELQRARLHGLKTAIHEAGLVFDPSLVVTEGRGGKAGYLGIKRLLAQDNLPPAVFCYHDLSAYGAIEALKEAGLRVPEDVSIVGFDDIFMSRYISLTTLSQPFAEMGRLAAQILLDQLTAQMQIADIRVIPTLVVRGSTGECSKGPRTGDC